MDQQSVYMIVQLKIDDMETFFSQYAPKLGPINSRHGAELLVGTPSVNSVEGIYEKNFTVVLRFPNAQAQQEWYSDPEYAPLKALRHSVTDVEASTIIVAPQFTSQ